MAQKKKRSGGRKRPAPPAPWERAAPAKKKASSKRGSKLTSAQKKRAKQRAKRAGRPYPNLVDNMLEASGGRAQTGKRTKKRG
jgi:hypothetical protein